MRHILAGLTLAGALTLSTIAAFAGDDLHEVPALPDRTVAQIQPQEDAAGAAGTTVIAPSFMEQRGNNYEGGQ